MLIGQKNGLELAPSLLPYVDFAVLEDCKALRESDPDYAFCSDFQPFATGGSQKQVFSIEYPTSLESPAGSGTCSVTGQMTRRTRQAAIR
jgi:hypothetical protein